MEKRKKVNMPFLTSHMMDRQLHGRRGRDNFREKRKPRVSWKACLNFGLYLKEAEGKRNYTFVSCLGRRLSRAIW